MSSIVLKWEVAAPGPSDAPITHYEVRGLGYCLQALLFRGRVGRDCARTRPTPLHIQVSFRALGDLDTPEGGASEFTPFLAVGGPSDTAAEISGLTHSTLYEFVVRAVNACGPGPASPPSTPARTLGKPTGTHVCMECLCGCMWSACVGAVHLRAMHRLQRSSCHAALATGACPLVLHKLWPPLPCGPSASICVLSSGSVVHSHAQRRCVLRCTGLIEQCPPLPPRSESPPTTPCWLAGWRTNLRPTMRPSPSTWCAGRRWTARATVSGVSKRCSIGTPPAPLLFPLFAAYEVHVLMHAFIRVAWAPAEEITGSVVVPLALSNRVHGLTHSTWYATWLPC